MFITREEEKALGISEHNTVDWRRQNNIPNSDEFELGKTRKRSDTVSPAHSDSHDQKKEPIRRDTRGDITTRVYVTEYAEFHIPNSNCGKRFRASAQPHSHDRTGGLISLGTPVHAPWGHGG